jgi:hypothetical protein
VSGTTTVAKRSFTLLSLAMVAAMSAACHDHDHDHEEATSLVFTVSGEEPAISGYGFPPAPGSTIAVVDGWEIRFDRVLVTIDDLELSATPDLSPTDQSQAGEPVARAKGPWAVNLSVAGQVGTPPEAKPASLRLQGEGHDHGGPPATGRGSAEDSSIRLVTFTGQNLKGNAEFAPDQRYAFGYRLVPASAAANRVNLDAAAGADYDEMVQKGWTTLYVGTATFKGTNCTSGDASYDFSKLPTSVKFRLGFATPTTYRNCQNSDLTGKAFDGEEFQRGIQVVKGRANYAQITFHLEHAFWDSVVHDQARMFFDQMAAAAQGGLVTSEELKKLDPAGFVDAQGNPLPWRSCLDASPAPSGQRKFNTSSVPLVGQNGNASQGLRHYEDYVAYQVSTMGHLNANGLCAPQREFPSPR